MNQRETSFYLEVCKQLIEKCLQLHASKNWMRRDYVFLSEQIFKKTSIQLSVSTLKRIWSVNSRIIPQISTLNALAQFIDYPGWHEFVTSNHGAAIEPKKAIEGNVNSGLSKYWMVAGAAVLLLLMVLGLSTVNSEVDPNLVSFSVKKNIKEGLPNTVVFQYDISKINFHEAFIQQDWDDRRRSAIRKDANFHTSIYYYPGYYDAKLIVDNQVVKTAPLLVKTDGWLPLARYERYAEKPVYLKTPTALERKELYVSQQELTQQGIKTEREYFTSFYNVRDFGEINADDFTLVSEIKNNTDEGGAACQLSEVVLKFEDGRLLTPFANLGCTAILDVAYGEKYLSGQDHDFTCFGTNLNSWKTTKIAVKNKHVQVFIADRLVYENEFEADMGKLIGLHYAFQGSGAVRNIRLYNKNDELTYQF